MVIPISSWGPDGGAGPKHRHQIETKTRGAQAHRRWLWTFPTCFYCQTLLIKVFFCCCCFLWIIQWLTECICILNAGPFCLSCFSPEFVSAACEQRQSVQSERSSRPCAWDKGTKWTSCDISWKSGPFEQWTHLNLAKKKAEGCCQNNQFTDCCILILFHCRGTESLLLCYYCCYWYG